MAALQAALALAEVRDLALSIADDLHLDVTRARTEPLHQQCAIAERRRGLRLAARVALLDLVGRADHAHAAPAAAGDRLDHHRIVVAERREERLRLCERHRAVAAEQDGHLKLNGEISRPRLVAEQFQRLHRRADEADARRRAAPREFRALGEEAVARVQRVAARCLRGVDHRVDIEVGAAPHALQRMRLIGAAHMQRRRVVRGVDRDRCDPKFTGGADNSDRDLAAVGNQDLVNRHWASSNPARIRRASARPAC